LLVEEETILAAADGMNVSIVLSWLCRGQACNRLSQSPSHDIWTNTPDDVAQMIIRESNGREMGLRRVLVDACLTPPDGIEMSEKTLKHRFFDSAGRARDDALLELKWRGAESPKLS